MRRLSSVLLILGFLLVAPSADARDSYHPAVDASVLPVPDSLVPAVEFWRDIFATYDDNQIVIHDDRHLDLVYGVVDVSDLLLSGLSDVQRASERRSRVRDAMDEVRAILRTLAGDRRVPVDPGELERIRRLTAPFSPDRNWYRAAQGRVRSQTGLQDEFMEAIRISGMFMPGIAEALRQEGVPEAIRALPFVESMFNYRARSKVGASGAWQFTRSTGRLYLRIDAAVDERSDVLHAAHGAAKYLKSNYRRVESWPLALTGYNHGIGGMARAVRQLGTKDIGVIVDRYESRSFGFASRNFYASFIAALVTYEERETLFPGIEPLPPLGFETFVPDRFVSLLDLAAFAGIPEERLFELNPAFSDAVRSGDLLAPSDFPVRVPPNMLTETLNAYELIPESRKLTRQLAQRHRVARGETLGQIANRYGSSVRAIQVANNLARPDRIYIGQMLEIPSTGGRSNWQRRLTEDQIAAIRNPPRESERTAPTVSTHDVRSGETLSVIASRYGTTVDELVAINGLRSPDRLRVGQRINLPSGGEAVGGRSYTVRSGDTLARIANAHSTSVQAIMRLNSLSSTVIQVGQVLRLP